MKTVITTAIVGLMLLGIGSAVASPNAHQKKITPVYSDGGPAPCFPGPGCTPIPMVVPSR